MSFNKYKFLFSFIFSVLTLLSFTISLDPGSIYRFKYYYILIFCLIFIYYYLLLFVDKFRNIIWTYGLALFIILFSLLGYTYHYLRDLNWLFNNNIELMKYFIVWVGESLFLGSFLMNLYQKGGFYIEKFKFKRSQWKWFESYGFIKILCILLILWLPYFIIHYPGTLTPDANESLTLFFGDKDLSWTVKTIELISPNVILNNHHPVFYTLFLGFFAMIGKVFGSIRFGLAIYTCIQCVFMAGVFSFAINYMIKSKVPHIYILICFLYVGLVPIVPLYMVTITKDIIYLGFIILGTIYIHKFIYHEFSFRDYVSSSLIFLGLSLSRNNGIYILIGSLVIFLLFMIKKWQSLLKLFLPTIIIFFLINLVLYPSLSISKGSPREMYSVPIQQIARTIKVNGVDWLNNDEQKCLENIFQVNNITELASEYNPEFADFIKNKFNKNTTSDQMSTFFSIWIKGLCLYPITYIDSFLANTYPYFSIYNSNREFVFYNNNPKPGTTNNDYSIRNIKMFSKAREFTSDMIYFLNDNPVTFIFQNMGISAISLLIGFVYVIFRKNYKSLLLFCLVGLNYFICYLGPVAYLRYGTSFVFIVPIILGLTYTPMRGDIKYE